MNLLKSGNTLRADWTKRGGPNYYRRVSDEKCLTDAQRPCVARSEPLTFEKCAIYTAKIRQHDVLRYVERRVRSRDTRVINDDTRLRAAPDTH